MHAAVITPWGMTGPRSPAQITVASSGGRVQRPMIRGTGAGLVADRPGRAVEAFDPDGAGDLSEGGNARTSGHEKHDAPPEGVGRQRP